MRFHGLWILLGMTLCAPSRPAGTEGGAPLAALWKEQRVSFFHMGRTSRYSCDGLRDKVRAMLLELGARRDLTITALGCADTAATLRAGSAGPSLNMVFSTPVLPGAGAKPLHAGDLAPVNARFEPFTITSDAFRNMGAADCELVEEFAHQVLPKLATRNVKQDISCVPYQESGGGFLVRGEILRSLPSS